MTKKEKHKAKEEKTPLQKAEEKIKLCAAFAYISAALTVGLSLLALTGTEILDIVASDGAIFSVMEGLIIGALGFGVSKKSRVCALVLLTVFCLDKVLQIAAGTNPSSMIASILIWGSIYLGGVTGVFAWHKLKKSAPDDEEMLSLADGEEEAANI